MSYCERGSCECQNKTGIGGVEFEAVIKGGVNEQALVIQ